MVDQSTQLPKRERKWERERERLLSKKAPFGVHLSIVCISLSVCRYIYECFCYFGVLKLFSLIHCCFIITSSFMNAKLITWPIHISMPFSLCWLFFVCLLFVVVVVAFNCIHIIDIIARIFSHHDFSEQDKIPSNWPYWRHFLHSLFFLHSENTTLLTVLQILFFLLLL